MAATATVLESWDTNGQNTGYLLSIAFDASYPNPGGEAIDVAKNTRIDQMLISPSGGYVFEWDAANQKIKAYYGDNNNAADGPLVEVPDTTNLSALTNVIALAFGQ